MYEGWLKLIDYLKKFAERLVIRILTITGASESAINAVTRSFEDRQTLTDSADKKIIGTSKLLKWLIIGSSVFILIFIVYKIVIIKLLRK